MTMPEVESVLLQQYLTELSARVLMKFLSKVHEPHGLFNLIKLKLGATASPVHRPQSP